MTAATSVGGEPVRGEPIDFLAFVENDLQGADAEGDEAEADVIDADALLAVRSLLQVGRIFDEPVGEIQRNNADGDVDVENPAPAEIVGDPAAEGGADGGGDDHGHAVDGESHAAFGGRESIGEDGLFAGLQAAAGGSLQDAEENQHAEGGREAAQETAAGEKRDAGHVETFAAEAGGQPGADRAGRWRWKRDSW